MSENFKPQESKFNPQDLVDLAKAGDFSNNEMIDPETRLARLRTESEIKPAEVSAMENIKSQAVAYLESQGININYVLLHNLSYELTSYIILEVKPTSNKDLASTTRLCQTLFRNEIYTLEQLRSAQENLDSLTHIGTKFTNYLKNILANNSPESENETNDI